MKKILLFSVAVAGLAVAAYFLFFKEPVFKATNGYLVNLNDKNVIIEGYDAVAYFTDNKSVKGNQQFAAQYEGATYWFASAEHAELFRRTKNMHRNTVHSVVMLSALANYVLLNRPFTRSKMAVLFFSILRKRLNFSTKT
jgi:YHS domain-containing protein